MTTQGDCFASMEVALGCVYIPELCFYTRILVSFYLALNDSFRAFSFGGNGMNDAEYMRLALALAEQGRGWTAPNPMVGAVIVKDGAVIGQGWHERYGEPHAERNALASCTADPAGATMYVTLEPCCHHGKQPPCVGCDPGIRHLPGGDRLRRPKSAGGGKGRGDPAVSRRGGDEKRSAPGM